MGIGVIHRAIDPIGLKNTSNAPINPATEEKQDAIVAAIQALDTKLTTEVDDLQAALVMALADVEAEIVTQGDEVEAAVLAAQTAIVAAIQALEVSGDTNSASVVAAVQAAQAALEAALGDVETAIDTAASTLDATIISEGDQTQAILSTLLTTAATSAKQDTQQNTLDALQKGTLANGAETTVDGTTGGVELIAANATRKALIVQNTGAANMRVGASGVTATTGHRIVPGGHVIFRSPVVTNAVYAIRESAISTTGLAQEVI